MSRKLKLFFWPFFVLISFYLIASGCTWVTFTAYDQLSDKIVISSSATVESIYLKFSSADPEAEKVLNNFEAELKNNLKEKRYKVVDSEEKAHLTAKFKIHCYTKKEGTLYFFLGVIHMGDIVNGWPYDTRGVKVQAFYITTKGKWNKTYRAYRKDNYIKIASAIIQDLNQLIVTKEVLNGKENLH